MTSSAFAVVFLGLVVTCAACDGGDTGESAGPDGGSSGSTSATTVAPYSCLSTTGNCLDFQGSAYLDARRQDVEQKGCTANKGTPQATPCTATGRIGRCIQRQGTATQGVINYYSGDLTMLESNCTKGGDTWQAG